MTRITPQQWGWLRQWGPAGITALCAWLLLLLVGQTQLARASGLALAILGVTASMRPMGLVASMAGGLTLDAVPGLLVADGRRGNPTRHDCHCGCWLWRRPCCWGACLLERKELAAGLGASVLFIALFWSPNRQGAELAAYRAGNCLAVVSADGHAAADQPATRHQAAASRRKAWQLAGISAAFCRRHTERSIVHAFRAGHPARLAAFGRAAASGTIGWLILATVIGGLILADADLSCWRSRRCCCPWDGGMPCAGWRWANIRWRSLACGRHCVGSAMGLARLARWYPPLGTVTIIAFACLHSLRADLHRRVHREILLMPLIIIQVMWMTYAVNTISQWVNKSLRDESRVVDSPVVSALYFAAAGAACWSISCNPEYPRLCDGMRGIAEIRV